MRTQNRKWRVLGLILLATLCVLLTAAKLYWPDGWKFPVPGQSITAEFCADNTGFGAEACHSGIDIGTASNRNADILSAGSGVVTKVQKNWAGFRNGNVCVFHGWDAKGNPITTHYGHVRGEQVRVGQTVEKGQIIAKAYGAPSKQGFQWHLHFGALKNRNCVYSFGENGFFNPLNLPTISTRWDEGNSERAVQPESQEQEKEKKPQPKKPSVQERIEQTKKRAEDVAGKVTTVVNVVNNPVGITGVVLAVVFIIALVISPIGTLKATWGVTKFGIKGIFATIQWGWYLLDTISLGATHEERARNKRIKVHSCILVVFLFSCCSTIAFLSVVSERVGNEQLWSYILSQTGNYKPLAKVAETVEKTKKAINEAPRVVLVPAEVPVIKKPIKVPTTIRKKPVPSGVPEGAKAVQAKISHYWPPLGGPNCSNFRNGKCLSHMASGKKWQDWVDRAVACPSSYPFGTKVYAFDQEWVCMDRGGKIVAEGGYVWLDFLTNPAPKNTPYGAVRTVYVIFPGGEKGR